MCEGGGVSVRQFAFETPTMASVSWSKRIQDPIAFFIGQTTETLLVFEGRYYTVAKFAEFGGLIGFASAAVELLSFRCPSAVAPLPTSLLHVAPRPSPTLFGGSLLRHFRFSA